MRQIAFLFSVLIIALGFGSDVTAKDDTPAFQALRTVERPDIPLPEVIRSSETRVFDDHTKSFSNEIIFEANKKKKNWKNKKPPKKGTGKGTFIFGYYSYEGDWVDYKLTGPFKEYYRDMLIFDGYAEDGVVKYGIRYRLDFYLPLPGGDLTKYKAYAESVVGHYSVPEYQGYFEKVSVNKDGMATYVPTEGFEYFVKMEPRLDSDEPGYHWVREANRTVVGTKSFLNGEAVIYQRPKDSMPKDQFLLAGIMNFKYDELDGTYENYDDRMSAKPNSHIVRVEFENGKLKKREFTVITDDRREFKAPFRNLRHKSDDAPHLYLLSFETDAETAKRLQLVKDLQQMEADTFAALRRIRNGPEPVPVVVSQSAPPVSSAKMVNVNHTLTDADNAFAAGNYAKARELYLPYAEADVPGAQNMMGVFYADGLGVGVDDKKAAYWFRRASNLGLAAAQYHLGSMIYHGRAEGGVDPRATAISWLERAAANGAQPAKDLLANIAEAERQGRVNDWKDWQDKMRPTRCKTKVNYRWSNGRFVPSGEVMKCG